MKKFYYLLILVALGLPMLTNAQADVFFDGFETGYTDGSTLKGVNGWSEGGNNAELVIKTVNSAGQGYNGSDWFGLFEIGNYYTVASKSVTVEAPILTHLKPIIRLMILMEMERCK